LGHAPRTALASPAARDGGVAGADSGDGAGPGFAMLFSPAYRATTLLITAAYFFHIISFYFLLKWVPKIVVDMGFEPSSAGGVLVWASAGGATGGALFGLLLRRVALKKLTLVAMALSIIAIIGFGAGSADLAQLSIVAAVTGMATNAAVVGLYALLAEAFPASLRGAGTGFAIGVGRAGAAIAPILAGILFQAGLGLQSVAMVMSMGSAIAAIILFIWRGARGGAGGAAGA
ncbi:MAG: MFS transporter, partial [Sphingopyxis sp.]